MPPRRRVPLPDFDWSSGKSPFIWIIRTAPMVREARREIAEREREDRAYDRQEDNRPARPIGQR